VHHASSGRMATSRLVMCTLPPIPARRARPPHHGGPAYQQVVSLANDRNYLIGDRLVLREFDESIGAYTGRQCTAVVTSITSHDEPCAVSSEGLNPEFCILTIRVVAKPYDRELRTAAAGYSATLLKRWAAAIERSHHPTVVPSARSHCS
jgi:Domain of unknown function (DUF3850)